VNATPGHAVKWFFVYSRDAIAAGLVRLGVTPNGLTWAGLAFTCAGAACLAAGASHQLPVFGRAPGPQVSFWPLWAGLFLLLACAMDMLDGAVARLGKLRTQAGAMLDSTVDRCSDAVLYVAVVGHFAWHGNVTYAVLAAVAMVNTFVISYAAARAENMVADCHVGWWQRGERMVSILLGSFTGHVAALLWHQAILPAGTAIRRIRFAIQCLSRQARGLDPPSLDPPPDWRRYVMLWRYPRLTLAHDLLCVLNAAWLLVAPILWPYFYGRDDFLRRLIQQLSTA
jgi:CDP-diacylglycerol--glycerol-3-phosphate 3-phosphatidyltransferase